MAAFDTYYNDRKYEISLDEKGNPIGYSVFMITRSGKGTYRRLWAARHGKTMPKQLQEIMQKAPHILESIANAMNW